MISSAPTIRYDIFHCWRPCPRKAHLPGILGSPPMTKPAPAGRLSEVSADYPPRGELRVPSLCVLPQLDGTAFPSHTDELESGGTKNPGNWKVCEPIEPPEEDVAETHSGDSSESATPAGLADPQNSPR